MPSIHDRDPPRPRRGACFRCATFPGPSRRARWPSSSIRLPPRCSAATWSSDSATAAISLRPASARSSSRVVDLFQRAHALGVRDFVLAQDTHDLSGRVRGLAGALRARHRRGETIPELQALPFADRLTVIEKNSHSRALESGFDAWLDAHPRLRTAIVVGNCTDLCVYQLAYASATPSHACNLPGMTVIVPADAFETYHLSQRAVTAIGAFPHPATSSTRSSSPTWPSTASRWCERSCRSSINRQSSVQLRQDVLQSSHFRLDTDFHD